MAFTIEFDIPTEAYIALQDTVVWDQVKELSAKDLKKYVFKFVKSKGYNIVFRDLSKEDPNSSNLTLGLNFQPDHDIHICSTNLSLSEFPAILIHEILHSLFKQLDDEDKIHTLEKKVIDSVTIVEANRLLKEIFKNAKWEFKGPVIRRVESLPTPAKQRRTKRKPASKKTCRILCS